MYLPTQEEPKRALTLLGSSHKMIPMAFIKKQVELISAGGVVLRETDEGKEVVLCGRNHPTTWGLPKGTPNPGETIEQTALREVREETGLEVEIASPIDGVIQYWFERPAGSVRYHKTVYYYLMRSIGGNFSLHDHEFDTVDWFTINRALTSLTYENEARVVEKGIAVVEK